MMPDRKGNFKKPRYEWSCGRLPMELRRHILGFIPAHSVTTSQLNQGNATHWLPSCISGSNTEPPEDVTCAVCSGRPNTKECMASLRWSPDKLLWACGPCIRRRLYYMREGLYYRLGTSLHDSRLPCGMLWVIMPGVWSPEILEVVGIARFESKGHDGNN